MIGVNATRMVFLVDELEKLGLVERRRNPADRRSHALYLTEQGVTAVDRVRAVTEEHEAEFAAGLTEDQRAQLVALLRVMAQEQGLPPGGCPAHPRTPRRSPADRHGLGGWPGGQPGHRGRPGRKGAVPRLLALLP